MMQLFKRLFVVSLMCTITTGVSSAEEPLTLIKAVKDTKKKKSKQSAKIKTKKPGKKTPTASSFCPIWPVAHSQGNEWIFYGYSHDPSTDCNNFTIDYLALDLGEAYPVYCHSGNCQPTRTREDGSIDRNVTALGSAKKHEFEIGFPKKVARRKNSRVIRSQFRELRWNNNGVVVKIPTKVFMVNIRPTGLQPTTGAAKVKAKSQVIYVGFEVLLDNDGDGTPDFAPDGPVLSDNNGTVESLNSDNSLFRYISDPNDDGSKRTIVIHTTPHP